MNEKIIRVSDVMKPKFITMDRMETVAAALQRMNEEGANVVIVNKRNADDEYGIVLLTNIVSEVLALNRAPDRVNVYEIMSKPVITVNADMVIKNCARLFANVGISTAPVLEGDEIVGIVSYRELAFGGLSSG